MKDHDFLKNTLQNELKNIQLDNDCDAFLQYIFLLNKWNQAYNLTAVRTPFAMLSKHILDSLAILPWLKGPYLIDVGSGAGLPGIPLAIAKPDFHFILLDSNGKKTRFLNEVKRQLDLKNLEVVQFRVENYHPHQRFDTVVSRAFSSLEQMIHWTTHLLNKEGVWLAMKGRYPEDELKALNHPYQVEQYTVPGVDGERCCILINRPNELN